MPFSTARRWRRDVREGDATRACARALVVGERRAEEARRETTPRRADLALRDALLPAVNPGRSADDRGRGEGCDRRAHPSLPRRFLGKEDRLELGLLVVLEFVLQVLDPCAQRVA